MSPAVFALLVVLGLVVLCSAIFRIVQGKPTLRIHGVSQLINDFKHGNFARGFAIIAAIVAYVICIQLFAK